MHCTRKVTEDIIWIGGSDRRLALFENIFPIPRGVSYNSYLLKDEKTNMTIVSDKGKEAELSYNLIDFVNNLSLVKINLKTGRSHQIRVQFASRKIPLYGDQRYNPNAVKDQIALFASKIEFKHPITNEDVKFELPLPERYPFTLFKSETL